MKITLLVVCYKDFVRTKPDYWYESFAYMKNEEEHNLSNRIMEFN